MSRAPTLIQDSAGPAMVRFERRDAILVIGVGLLAVGLLPFILPVYALAVAAAVFIGIKWYSEWRQRVILSEVGRGICAECGSAITGDKCLQCDGADA